MPYLERYELKELTDEITSLKEKVRMLNQLCEFNEEGQRRLIEQLAECKKDAERLDWLIKSNWYVGPNEFYCTEGGDLVEFDDKNDCHLRANIDAAMAQKEEA
jgi:hypothetical protein